MDVIIAKSKTHKISHLVADPNYNKRRKRDLESYEKINNIKQKICYICQNIKLVNDFYKCKLSSDGYKKYCKACCK